MPKTIKKTHEQFVIDVENKFKGEYTVLGRLINMRTKIKLKHNICGHEFDTIPDTLLNVDAKISNCPKCNGRYISQDDYIKLLKSKNPTIIPLEQITKKEIKILHKCIICKHEWKVTPETLIGKNPSGCPICKGGTNVVVIGVNDMWTTNSELAKLLANPEDGCKYTQGSNSKVCFKCPECGEVSKPLMISKVKNKGFSCKRCSLNRSLPNRTMYNLLSELNIDFEDEVVFKWCTFIVNNIKHKGIYDFYFNLNDKKYIIEMDGYFHDNDNNMNGQTKEESEYIDIQKDILANKNNIEIIRINCVPSTVNVIKNSILNSKLSILFNLNDIDWNKCFYKSANTIIRDTWKLHNEGMTVRQIAAFYNKDVATIMKYLDYGTSLGECNYLREGNIRKIVCVNDGNVIYGLQKANLQYKRTSVNSISRNCNHINKYAGYDNLGLPLVFCDYNEYLNLSEYDKLKLIQDSFYNAFPHAVICLNNHRIFENSLKAKEYCGASISGVINYPEKYKTAGIHPITGKRLYWKKLIDYKNECNQDNEVAFSM